MVEQRGSSSPIKGGGLSRRDFLRVASLGAATLAAPPWLVRDADFLFKGEVLWEPEDDPSVIAANLEWLDGFMEAMQPHLSGGAYQNFTDRTLLNWPQEYYGENFARLVEVKRAWDPGNLFRFPQSIPVTT